MREYLVGVCDESSEGGCEKQEEQEKNNKISSGGDKAFDTYMNYVDATMLRLNIEACSMILKELKKDTDENSSLEDKTSSEDACGEFCMGPGVEIDVKEYKAAMDL